MKKVISVIFLVLFSLPIYSNNLDETTHDFFSRFGFGINRYSINIQTDYQSGTMMFDNVCYNSAAFYEDSNSVIILNIGITDSLTLSTQQSTEKTKLIDTDSIGVFLQSHYGLGNTFINAKDTKVVADLGINLTNYYLFHHEADMDDIMTVGVGANLLYFSETNSVLYTSIVGVGYDLFMIYGDLINQTAYAGGLNLSFSFGLGTKKPN